MEARSIVGISENVRSRRIKAFLQLFRVYEQKNVQKPKLIRKVSGGKKNFKFKPIVRMI